MKENLINLCKFYGVRHQIKRAQSEIFELNEAILNYENAKDSIYTQDFDKLRRHVAEEYADTLNMLSQIIYSYDISDEEIRQIQEQKIARQLQRVEDESRNKTIDRIRKDDLV